MTTIIKYTIKEMFKKRALILTLILTLVYLALYSFGLYDTYKHNTQTLFLSATISSTLISAGLYFASFIIAFLVVLTSVNSISGEIENGTIFAVLVKPLKRYELVLGKFFGIALMIIVYSLIFFFAIIGLNILFGANISINAASLIKSALLFSAVPLILLSITIYGSSRHSTLNTGIITVMLYGFAMVGGILEQVGYFIKQQGLMNAGIISSLLMPTDITFRKMTNILFNNGGINILSGTGALFGSSNPPSIWMTVYTGLYIIFFLMMAVYSFEKRDI